MRCFLDVLLYTGGKTTKEWSLFFGFPSIHSFHVWCHAVRSGMVRNRKRYGRLDQVAAYFGVDKKLLTMDFKYQLDGGQLLIVPITA